MVQMEDVVSRLERWQGGKGVIFRGASQFFCSGVELGMVRAMVSKDDNVHLMATLMQDITSRVLSLPLVSVALIEGGALGGGAELSSSCDYRVATDKSKISFLHVSTMSQTVHYLYSLRTVVGFQYAIAGFLSP